MKQYTRIDAGTGRVHPLSDSDWPDNTTEIPMGSERDRQRAIERAQANANFDGHTRYVFQNSMGRYSIETDKPTISEDRIVTVNPRG